MFGSSIKHKPHTKERKMTKLTNTHIFSATATFGAAVMMSMISLGGSAEASTNPLRCQGDSAKKVVACCEQMIVNKRPLWMRQTGTSCNNIAVSCKFKRVGFGSALTHVAAPRFVKICKIVRRGNDNHDNNPNTPEKRQEPRNPRGNQTSSVLK
jgi:hypothetical protein